MTETQRICQQMKQALEGEAWHGPALLEIPAGIDAATAIAKPIPGGHSIWKIIAHLTATQRPTLRNAMQHKMIPELLPGRSLQERWRM